MTIRSPGSGFFYGGIYKEGNKKDRSEERPIATKATCGANPLLSATGGEGACPAGCHDAMAEAGWPAVTRFAPLGGLRHPAALGRGLVY